MFLRLSFLMLIKIQLTENRDLFPSLLHLLRLSLWTWQQTQPLQSQWTETVRTLTAEMQVSRSQTGQLHIMLSRRKENSGFDLSRCFSVLTSGLKHGFFNLSSKTHSDLIGQVNAIMEQLHSPWMEMWAPLVYNSVLPVHLNQSKYVIQPACKTNPPDLGLTLGSQAKTETTIIILHFDVSRFQVKPDRLLS